MRPAEMRAFLKGCLPTGRTQELQSELRAVGLPLWVWSNERLGELDNRKWYAAWEVV